MSLWDLVPLGIVRWYASRYGGHVFRISQHGEPRAEIIPVRVVGRVLVRAITERVRVWV